MKKIYISYFIISAVMFTFNSGCKKSLDVAAESGDGSLAPDQAIKTPADMQYLLNSCYDACANMMNGRFQIVSDLLADDITAPSNGNSDLTGVYKRIPNTFNSYTNDVFAQPYFTIYRCNVMDLYYDKVSGLSSAEKQRMQGESAFLRAMCHWEAVKLWAQPYGYTGDNSHLGIMLRKRALNEAVPRSTVAQTYDFIISDLNNAISKLSAGPNMYANQYAAKALLAKVYFQMGKYTDALPLLNDVINNGPYTLSDSLNRFRRDNVNSEIIFGFISGDDAYEIGSRASEFKDKYRSDLSSNPPYIGLSNDLYSRLIQQHQIDTLIIDKRLSLVKLFNEGQANQVAAITKFDQVIFATPYLHLTDMILMRAEILAIQGDGPGATADITKIINRAYVDPAPVIARLTSPSLIENIRIQRRFELMCEGDRVQQLKRIGVTAGRGNLKIRNVNWDCDGMVVQFPSSCGTSNLFVFNPSTPCN